MAVEFYKKAIGENPQDAQLHYELANILKSQKDLEGAIKEFCTAIELKQDFASAYFALGHAFYLKNEPFSSTICYIRAVELDPQYDEPNTSLGNIYGKYQ